MTGFLTTLFLAALASTILLTPLMIRLSRRSISAKPLPSRQRMKAR